MNTKPLKESLPDEHILRVKPRPRPVVDAGWRSRPHLYSGRALSAEALATEQRERSGRLALWGQLVASGVVAGLEVGLEREYDPELKTDVHLFQISPGQGLAPSGEDVHIPRPTRIRLDKVPAFWLGEGQDPSSFDLSVLNWEDPVSTHTNPETGKLLQAAVLVLVPVVSKKDDPIAPDEQGQLDPDAYSFEDQHQVDGCAAVLFAWPMYWSMPTPTAPDWRSRLAWMVFDYERQRRHQDRAPWEQVGVPVALVGFQTEATSLIPLFADRASVVRRGGAPRGRTPLLDAHGSPLLWQARIQHFSEHLASFTPEQITSGLARKSLAFLPPVGTLPKYAVDPFDFTPRFFPSSFLVDAAPVPLEQLDAVALASASLAPLSLEEAEHVRVLVPVPQVHFDPSLLRGEVVDPAFQEAITSGLARLAEWLRRRGDLRHKAVLLLNAIEGRKSGRFPAVDPAAIPGEYEGLPLPQPSPYGPEEEAYGTVGNTVRVLDDTLLQWGKDGTWAEPALLGFESQEVTSAISDAGQFGLVSREGQPPEGSLSRTSFQETWRPWETIPDVLSNPEQTFEGFRTVWSEGRLALVALVSQPAAPLRLYTVRVYHYNSALQLWSWQDVGQATFTRAPHFASVAWDSQGHIDTFVAMELDTTSDTGVVTTSYKILKFTWMRGSATQPPVVDLPEVADKKVEDMVALRRGDGRIELLFLGLQPSTDESTQTPPWLHHLSGFHEIAGGDATTLPQLRRIEVVETTDVTGTRLAACLTGAQQLDALVMRVTGGEGSPAGIFHGRYTTDWRFDSEAISTIVGDELVATSRLDDRVHAFWWVPSTLESNTPNALFYAWFDGSRWHPARELLRVPLHTSPQPFSVVLDGTAQIDVFLASLTGLQHLRMLPDSARSLVESQGLRGLIAQTDSLLGRLDDLIQAGSAQVQADTQNVRQLMISGNTEASRLVVSPILGATMVPNPLAARSDIESYFTRFLKRGRLALDAESDATQEDARETLEQATETRRDLTARLIEIVKDLGLDVTGMTLAGVAKITNLRTDDAAVEFITEDDGTVTKFVSRESLALDVLVADPVQLDDALERIKREPAAIEQALSSREDRWESADYFTTAVLHLENTLILLRELERRTSPYTSALASYRAALAQIEGFWSSLEQRLKFVDGEVAEARQDVTVARALLVEEQARVASVNQRRRSVYEQHVPFLVFQRPRVTELTEDTPTRMLDPGFFENILPEVFESTAAAPPELLAYVELIRDSPLRWFSLAATVLRKLDRTELIHRTFEWAQVRATQRIPVRMPVIPGRTSPRLAQGLSRILSTREELIARQRFALLDFQPAILQTRTWLELQQSAHQQLSLGDLTDAAHGRSDVGRTATTELEHISKVATGLYQRFGEVLPAIRLEWSDQMSQYDAPVDLRDLSRLPRFSELEVTDRRELQTLVDWLFQRVVRTAPEASSLINDLVRVCMLLASHAPVNELLSGHVAKNSVAKVGGTLELAVDPARVRVGMHVLIRSGAHTVQAVVEDLSSTVVRARVLSTTAPTITLAENTSAHFSDPTRGLGALVPYVGRRR